MSYSLTDEQTAIVDASRASGDVSVIAGAGAGKSSTLREVAKANPNRRMLYVVYNRANKDEARDTFPSNVRPVTAHGLAYGPVGTKYANAGRLDIPKQSATVLARLLGVTQPFRVNDNLVLSAAQIAAHAAATVDRFSKTADPLIVEQHVPNLPGVTSRIERDALRAVVLPAAHRMWDDVRDIQRGRVKVTLNHVLKLFQLSNPVLPYGLIAVDEAQDLNGAMYGIVQAQSNHPGRRIPAQIMMVGDPAQAINGWNGARDYLSIHPAEHRLTLSKSFRFGPAVADLANEFLDVLGSDLRITGFEKINSRVVDHIDDPDMVLVRSNADAIAEVVALLDNGRKVFLKADHTEIREVAESVGRLKNGQRPEHIDFIGFNTYAELQDYADTAGDTGLATYLKLIDQRTPEGVLDLLKKLSKEKDAEVTVMTSHKSKGLEADRIDVRGTYLPEDREPSREDLMLGYVTATRGRKDVGAGNLLEIRTLRAARSAAPAQPAAQDGGERPAVTLSAVPAPKPEPEEPVTVDTVADAILDEGAAPDTAYMAQRLRSIFPGVDPALIGDIVLTATTFAYAYEPDRRMPNLVTVGRELKAAAQSATPAA
jgi:hypothetical protein